MIKVTVPCSGGKNVLFEQAVLGQLDIHMEKKDADPYLAPYIKINSRSVTDPSGKGETIKL